MIYRLGRALFRLIYRVVFRWRVFGRENVPPSGPVILCANHTSYWDPPLVGAATIRDVYFMAKRELFHLPVLGLLMPRVNAFPVDRKRVDTGAVKQSLRLLRQGQIVCIFPEGMRIMTGGLGEPQRGAALLAVKTGAPVVPVAIKGPFRPGRSVVVRFGTPIEFGTGSGRGRDHDIEAISRRIMAGIAELLGK